MNYFLTLILILFVYMSFWFVVSLIKKRNDVADVAWGLGFILMAWTSFLLSAQQTVQGLLICILVSVWGIRLAWHIHSRNKGKKEDYRYLAWRNEWGKWFYIRSYLQVYILQGFLLFLIILPLLLVNKTGINMALNSVLNPLGVATAIIIAIGTAVWLIGFYFEVVGDAQLSRFIKNPENKGKLMMSGLWAYTRHPNYFGEVTLWWGLWIVSISALSNTSLLFAIISLVGPLTITFLILKVSGIPMLEKKMEENPDFAEYKKRVSKFIPLLPKNN